MRVLFGSMPHHTATLTLLEALLNRVAGEVGSRGLLREADVGIPLRAGSLLS